MKQPVKEAAVPEADVWVSHDTHGRVYSHRLSY